FELLQERDEACVFPHARVGDDIRLSARQQQTFATADTKEEPCEPLRDTAADDEEVRLVQFVEESLRPLGLVLKGVHEFERVFLGDGIVWNRRELAEQMEHKRSIRVGEAGLQILHAVGRVRKYPRLRLTAETDLVDGAFEERVEGD